MWVRVISDGSTKEVEHREGVRGIKNGLYTRVSKHELAVREKRETASV